MLWTTMPARWCYKRLGEWIANCRPRFAPSWMMSMELSPFSKKLSLRHALRITTGIAFAWDTSASLVSNSLQCENLERLRVSERASPQRTGWASQCPCCHWWFAIAHVQVGAFGWTHQRGVAYPWYDSGKDRSNCKFWIWRAPCPWKRAVWPRSLLHRSKLQKSTVFGGKPWQHWLLHHCPCDPWTPLWCSRTLEATEGGTIGWPKWCFQRPLSLRACQAGDSDP